MSAQSQVTKSQQQGNQSPAKQKDQQQDSSKTTTTTTTSSTSIITTAVKAASSAVNTPLGAMFSSRNGSNTSASQQRSPVSPSRLTRLQEKEEMQNLNDRLVVYIDTVRRLEAENSRLNSIVLTYNDNATREVGEIKKLYEQELEDAKRLIDELAKEKARHEIEINKLRADSEEAANKLAKRDKEAKILEGKLKTADSEKIEYKSRYESLLSEQAHQSEELNKLRPHVTDLEKQLAKMKKQLEEETLLRVDLENKNQTLKEDLAFKSQLYAKENDQLRSSKRVEIEQVDVRLRDEYDSRLMAEMQRIRDETDREIVKMKEQVERSYLNRVADAESNAKRVQAQILALKEERDSFKAKSDEYTSELKSLLSKISSLEAKIKDSEDKLRKTQQRHDKDVSDKDAEIAQLRKEIDDMLKEYQELYDIKINLDTEIACYRKLLESEEHRLNISTASASAAQLGASYIEPASATRSGKKRRLAQQLDQDDPEQSKRVAASSTSEKKVRTTPQRTAAAAAAGGGDRPQQQASAVQKLFGLWKS